MARPYTRRSREVAVAVKSDSVRHWRWTFGREGVFGLRNHKAPLTLREAGHHFVLSLGRHENVGVLMDLLRNRAIVIDPHKR